MTMAEGELNHVPCWHSRQRVSDHVPPECNLRKISCGRLMLMQIIKCTNVVSREARLIYPYCALSKQCSVQIALRHSDETNGKWNRDD